ncbi:helix-turn-helix domain-containing protein [Sorangium sp. So ce136]|uniref:ArsR/SmtB family transcription factor n=1 Tax=Sorangium sp. So ce136 TaxID=3133284 RepID=UPI003F068D26
MVFQEWRAALADPTRRAILARLAGGEATASELVAPSDLRQPTISKQGRRAVTRALTSRRTCRGGGPTTSRRRARTRLGPWA